MDELGSLKTITKGAGVAFLGLVLSKALTFLYRLFMARNFTVIEYGYFSESIAVITLIQMFCLFGLSTAIVRYTAYYNSKKDEKNMGGVLLTSLKVALPLSIISTAVLFSLSDFISVAVFSQPLLSSTLALFSISLPFLCMSFIIGNFFAGLKIIKYQVLLHEILPSFLKVSILAGLWFFGVGTIGISLSWTLTSSLVFLAALLLLERKFSLLKNLGTFTKTNKEILFFSAPLFISSLVNTSLFWADTIIIGTLKDASFVGIYNSALPLAQLLLMVPVSFYGIFVPIATEFHSKKMFSSIKRINKIVNKWIVYISTIFLMPLIFFPTKIIGILFGTQYSSDAAWPLVILTLGYMAISFGYTSWGILAIEKRTKLIMFNNVIAAGFHVGLNIFLIPIYGIVGAAIATATAFTIKMIISVFLAWKKANTNPFSMSMAKGIIAGLISMTIVFNTYKVFFAGFSTLMLVPMFIGFCVLYLMFLLLFKSFEKEDLEMIKAIRNKTGINVSWFEKIIRKFI